MAKTFNQLVSDYKTISGDSSSSNETLGKTLMNDFIKQILRLRDWTFNRETATDSTEEDKQYYPLPYNCETIRKVQVEVNSITYTPKEIKNGRDWSRLNMISMSSDIPTAFHIKPSTREIGFYPIPSSDGNTITFTFQEKIKDLGEADYTTGTVSVTKGSSTITGSGTSWTSSMVGRYIKVTDYWYKITAVSSATSLTIQGEFGEDDVSGGSYTIAELVPLMEGFENLPLWKALSIYFQSRDTAGSRIQANEYKKLYTEGLEEMIAADKKTTNNILEQTEIEQVDPNQWPTITS